MTALMNEESLSKSLSSKDAKYWHRDKALGTTDRQYLLFLASVTLDTLRMEMPVHVSVSQSTT